MQKIWTTAPIPFTGQKRHFLKQLREAITPIVQPDTIIIDLFGGSGLMAHNAKRWFPNNRVIWNDYDGYADRLARTDETNKALQAMREATLPYRKEQAIPRESEAGLRIAEILGGGCQPMQTSERWPITSTSAVRRRPRQRASSVAAYGSGSGKPICRIPRLARTTFRGWKS